MHLIFLLFICAYIVFGIITGVRGRKKIKEFQGEITEKLKIKNYISTMIMQWGVMVAVLIMCMIAGISFADIGLRGVSFDYNIWFTAITLALCGAAFVLYFFMSIANAVSAKHRKFIADKSAESISKNPSEKLPIEILTPRNRKEKIAYFCGAVVTAGTTEEILFRGFLFYIIQMLFPLIPAIFVALIAFAMFGIGHAYQGITGMIRATVLGAVFGCLFLVTGSLIPSILLHCIVNLPGVFRFNKKDLVAQEKDVVALQNACD